MKKSIFAALLLIISACASLYAQVVMRVYKDGAFTEFGSMDSIVWVNPSTDDPDITDPTDTLPPFCPIVNLSVSTYAEASEVVSVLYSDLNCCVDDLRHGSNWGIKNTWIFSTHPTLDTQATGWDADFCTQHVSTTSTEVEDLWIHCYLSICTANKLLPQLSDIEMYPEWRNRMTAEVRMTRAFFYLTLAQQFGAVPLVTDGEDGSNTRNRPRAEETVMWDYIISEMYAAAELLTWYGDSFSAWSCNVTPWTKGAALAYLGDAYMWKARRCPATATECYQKAAAAFKQVLDCGQYELNRSYTTLWDEIKAYDWYSQAKEAIFAQVQEDAGWGAIAGSLSKFYTACPENGGWGSLFLSWEWYSSYEQGDKRRDASAVTSAVENISQVQQTYSNVNLTPSQYCFGYHPYLSEQVATNTPTFKRGTGETAPSIWSMKYWRNGHANWSTNVYCATNIYWKRLPHVMLDYAECCFNLGEDSQGWEMVDALRNRAFGNLEVGHATELSETYLPNLKVREGLTTYPLPFSTETAEVASAADYYTNLKNQKGFDSPVWKVAVNEERRKEFNCEPSLGLDMRRSGYMADHIAHNYPKDHHNALDNNYPWTCRSFEFDEVKELLPIPASVLEVNVNICQNPGY